MEPQHLFFTRWVYGLEYECENFISYGLKNAISYYSVLNSNRYNLALKVEIEPFKNKNSNTKGVNLYFRSMFPHNPKDETGLRPAIFKGCYYGDIIYRTHGNERKKVLVLLQVLKDEKELIVDVFDNYYPKNVNERTNTIKQHEWYKKKHP